MTGTALLLCTLLAAAPAAAQSDTSALVEASKDAKAKRKSSKSRVITNADVKKSKGKVIETAATGATDVKPQPSLVEKHAADRAARAASEARVAAAKARVEELERELARIETSYYEENDLDRRDTVIAKQFEETKKRLDAARQELEAAAPPQQPSPEP